MYTLGNKEYVCVNESMLLLNIMQILLKCQLVMANLALAINERYFLMA